MEQKGITDHDTFSNRTTLKKFLVLIIIMFNVFLLGILVSNVRDLKIKNSSLIKELSVKTPASEEPTLDRLTVVSADFRMYPSPTGKYILAIKATPEKGETTCDVEVFDDQGYRTQHIDLNKLLEVEQFSCGSGMYGLFSYEFLGWHEDDNLSFNVEKKITNVTLNNKAGTTNGGNITAYPYPKDNLRALDVNRKKELFLFDDVSQDRTQDKIIIVDLKNSKTIKELTFERDSLNSPVYDYLNDGYIYTQRFYTENTVETKVYYLKMDNLSTQLVLEDKRNYLGGRGCGPYRIRSTREGEVIFDPGGCLVIDKKYYAEDGYLHFGI